MWLEGDKAVQVTRLYCIVSVLCVILLLLTPEGYWDYLSQPGYNFTFIVFCYDGRIVMTGSVRQHTRVGLIGIGIIHRNTT